MFCQWSNGLPWQSQSETSLKGTPVPRMCQRISSTVGVYLKRHVWFFPTSLLGATNSPPGRLLRRTPLGHSAAVAVRLEKLDPPGVPGGSVDRLDQTYFKSLGLLAHLRFNGWGGCQRSRISPNLRIWARRIRE